MPEKQSVPVDVVDSHIHSRQKPSGEHVYDFDARHVFNDLAEGGVIMAHEMPNTKPPLTTYEEIKSRISELNTIENYGGLYFCYNGKNLDELKKCLANSEVRPFLVGVKIYPATEGAGSVTTNFGKQQDMYDFSLENDSELDQIGKFCSEQNLSITIHCEDPVQKSKIEKYGTVDDDTEPNFVGKTVIPLCEKYPELKFIVAHVSHKLTVERLKEAWGEGMKNIFVEITPHHLLLTTTEIQEMLGKDAIFGFCHPFVKLSGQHKNAISLLLQDGEYQDQILYGSDHAPHSESAKREKKFGGVPNHQGPQILLAWFRARGFTMNDQIVQKFFSGNAQRAFNGVPEWTERFKQKAGSILFTPSDYQEGISIPDRIHNDVVVNPWGKLLYEELKEHWVVPSKK